MNRASRAFGPTTHPLNRINYRLDLIMKWETPTATDLRFGFEITMYIANR